MYADDGAVLACWAVFAAIREALEDLHDHEPNAVPGVGVGRSELLRGHRFGLVICESGRGFSAMCPARGESYGG